MNDEELHEGIILLDPDALAAWQQRYAPAVIAWLLRGGLVLADAEEVWNDVFASTVAAAPGLTPRGISMRRYAFRVARNLRADRLEREHRLTTTPLDEGIHGEVGRPAESRPDQRRVDALKACLHEAPERYRVVLELADEGETTSEIALVFGIERDSVYQLQRRARLWMANCVKGKLP
jgi:RNA polymerase sigma-70 factor (ECF subfamily)